MTKRVYSLPTRSGGLRFGQPGLRTCSDPGHAPEPYTRAMLCCLFATEQARVPRGGAALELIERRAQLKSGALSLSLFPSFPSLAPPSSLPWLYARTLSAPIPASLLQFRATPAREHVWLDFPRWLQRRPAHAQRSACACCYFCGALGESLPLSVASALSSSVLTQLLVASCSLATDARPQLLPVLAHIQRGLLGL